MNLSDRVRQKRKELGLSQQELAKLTGMAQSAIGQIENGRNKRTTKILELAEALQTTPEYLLNGIQTNCTSQSPHSIPLLYLDQAAEYLLNTANAATSAADSTKHSYTFTPYSSYALGVKIHNHTLGNFLQEHIKVNDILIIEPKIYPRDGDLILLCLQNTGYIRGLIGRLKIEIDGSQLICHDTDEFVPIPEGGIIGGVVVEIQRHLIPAEIIASRLNHDYNIMDSLQ